VGDLSDLNLCSIGVVHSVGFVVYSHVITGYAP
jgi:hypothetical protein